MSSYRKPTKLLSLNLYSPFLTYSNNRRLISRDKQTLSTRFHGEKEPFSKTQQPVVDTCIRSFCWMYRSPSCRNTTYHQTSLGKDRLVRLDPISKTPSAKFESPKKFVARKPTITMRKSLAFNLFPTQLTEQVLHGSLTLTSALLETPEGSLYLPLNHLQEVLFAPESEIIFNLTKCTQNNKWELSQNLYTNIEEVSSDYSSPIFLPNFQLVSFILKSKGMYSRSLGTLTKTFESKGLTLKCFRMIEFNGPCVVMALQGCEAQTTVANILSSLPADFYELLPWDRAQKLLPSSNSSLDPDPIPKLTFYTNSHYQTLTFPHLKYTELEKPFAIPLGLLKEMALENFSNWSEIWLKRNENVFPHRRSGLDNSSLKASLCVKGDPCVLTLNSYEIQISNHELEAGFAFKLSDMELILNHSGNEMIGHLMKTAQLVVKENRGRATWDLVIEVDDIPHSKGEVPKESKVRIGGKEFKCKFFTPTIEFYKPHTGENAVMGIRVEDLHEICKGEFKNWESIALKYFT